MSDFDQSRYPVKEEEGKWKERRKIIDCISKKVLIRYIGHPRAKVTHLRSLAFPRNTHCYTHTLAKAAMEHVAQAQK